MYSGLLPQGLTEADLSSDNEEDDVNKERENRKCESNAEKLSFSGENTDTNVEVQSPHTLNNSDGDAPTCSMPGISQEMWQKFQDLRKKKDEMKMVNDPRRRHRRKHKKAGPQSKESAESRELEEGREKYWDELKQYFGVNDRFHPPACSKPPPKVTKTPAFQLICCHNC